MPGVGHARARWTRRAVLAAAGVTLGAAGGPVPGLAAVAASRGFRYGTTTVGDLLRTVPGYAALVARQCALVAPVLNWNSISPRPGMFLRDTDRGVVRFARAHALSLTGAHLLWHAAVPAWFAALPGAAAARHAIEMHIARMGAAYGAMTWSINVVNEVLDPRGRRTDRLRRDAFARQLGHEYVNLAFQAARLAFPHALLLLNDYGMEQGAGMPERRMALLGLLDALRQAGTPIDGVGLQAHLTLADRFDPAGYADFLRRVASRGLRIVITELDVLDLAAPAAFAARDRDVADMYRRFLHATLDNPEVAGVVTWGLSDRDTWLKPSTSLRFARLDGLPTRPLPFDRHLRPKPVYFAMLECFSHAPLRPVGHGGAIGVSKSMK